jgi:DNA-binding response OmpR family regulator
MKKIYIVEDNQAIREVLEILLSSENYDVKSFGTVGEFSGRDHHNMPDLFLFDVMLPDGSGIDLCQEIKLDKNHEGIPVIMMSAHANLVDMKDICQPDALIAKPFDIDHVLRTIQTVIS